MMALQQKSAFQSTKKENGTNKLKFRMSKLLLNEIDLQENMLVIGSSKRILLCEQSRCYRLSQKNEAERPYYKIEKR